MEKAAIYSFESRRKLEAKKVTKKHFRIRWNRVALVLGLATLLVYGAISLVSDLIHIVPNWVQTQQESSIQSEIASYDQVKVVVSHGDTAWNLQKELTPNEQDVRYPLYLAKDLNPGVQLGNIKAGETVTLLKEKEIR